MVLAIRTMEIMNCPISKNLRLLLLPATTISLRIKETGAAFRILIPRSQPTKRLNNIRRRDGTSHDLYRITEARVKSRLRNFLKRGKKRNNKIKERIRLMNPMRRASVVNSEIIFFPDAPLIILIPIELKRFPVMDE
jgi:hypothetical protein